MDGWTTENIMTSCFEAESSGYVVLMVNIYAQREKSQTKVNFLVCIITSVHTRLHSCCLWFAVVIDGRWSTR